MKPALVNLGWLFIVLATTVALFCVLIPFALPAGVYLLIVIEAVTGVRPLPVDDGGMLVYLVLTILLVFALSVAAGRNLADWWMDRMGE